MSFLLRHVFLLCLAASLGLWAQEGTQSSFDPTYSEPIVWTLGDHDSDDGDVYKTINFATVRGVAYFLQSSHDLENWSNEQFVYGMGQDVTVSLWSEQDLLDPPGEGEAPGSFEELPTMVTLILRKVEGEPGLLVSFASLVDGSALQFYLPSAELVPEEAWLTTPLHVETVGDFSFFLLNSTMTNAEEGFPSNLTTSLSAEDAAMMTAFENGLATINDSVANGYATAQNTPPHPPMPPGFETYFRLSSDWSFDSDGDLLPDWWEWQGDANTDPFDPDSDGDGLPDGQDPSPGPDPGPEDSDGDGTPDVLDADPDSSLVDWQRTAESKFVIIEITKEFDELPGRLTEEGRVLFPGINPRSGRYWEGGQWQEPALPTGTWSASYQSSNYQFSWEAEHLWDINDKGDLLWLGVSRLENIPDEEEGGWWDHNYSIRTTILGSESVNQFSSFSNEVLPEYSSPGMLFANGRMVTHHQSNSSSPTVLRLYSAAGENMSVLPMSSDFSLRDTSPEGFVVGRNTSVGTWLLWDARGSGNIGRTVIPMAGNDSHFKVVELPNQRAGVAGRTAGNTRLLIETEDGALQNYASATGMTRWAGNGTAFGKNASGELLLWRNAETIPLGEVCPGYQELVEAGEVDTTFIDVVDTNNQGMALIAENNYTDKAYIALPITVEWVAAGNFDNIDDHVDPWSGMVKGKRIFPGYANPDQQEHVRHKATVKVSGGIPGMQVFLKAFDVDDSTSEQFDNGDPSDPVDYVIDENGRSGNDNFIDIYGTLKSGQFWETGSWGDDSASGVFDENGEFVIDFRIGMQPGNNYRVAVSVQDTSLIDDLQVDYDNESDYVGFEMGEDGGGVLSPSLTVWRKLWVENDSMKAAPVDANGYARNDLQWPRESVEISGSPAKNPGPPVTTSFKIPSIGNDEENLESFGLSHTDDPGYLEISGNRYPIVSGVAGVFRDTVTVSGDHSSIPADSGYRLYDDDDTGLFSAALPRIDLVNDQLKIYFQPAFIEVVDAKEYNDDKLIEFLGNSPEDPNDFEIAGDLSENGNLWVAPLTAAYQYTREKDQDPIGEGAPTLGLTANVNGIEHSVVFVEACREQYPLFEQVGIISDHTKENLYRQYNEFIVAIAAHEIGHQPGTSTDEHVDHEEGGLMQEGGTDKLNFPADDKFSVRSILRFREVMRWSK